MNKGELKKRDYIQSDTGIDAFVDKILPTKIRVWINGKKDYILDEQLHHWSYGNPIINNRIVGSKTFAIRFKQFLEWIPQSWVLSQPHYEEEYEYMQIIADHLLKYQIQTATDEEEIDYLKRLKLIK